MPELYSHSSLKRSSAQGGAGLIAFFMALIVAGAVFLITNSGPYDDRVHNEATTSEALAKAKSALLSHAVSYYYRQSNAGNLFAGHHGFLPCPETPGSTGEGNSIGSCGSDNRNTLGRLPWRTLEIETLTDGAGQCLWYAVSAGFKNNPKPGMNNDDTPGMFQVFNESGNLIHGTAPEDRIVAVVMAPGELLANQSRPDAQAGLHCKVPHDQAIASDYLDNFQNINNADVNTATDDQIDAFITASGLMDNTQLNDRIITITSNEIYDAIKANNGMYANKISQLGTTLATCLVDFAQAGITQSCSTITSCTRECDDDRDLCLLSAAPGPETAACNQIRRSCRRVCIDECITNNPPGNSGNNPGNSGNAPGNPGNNPGNNPGGGGGGGVNYFRLPWPAAVDLNADYRLDASYTDMTAGDIAANGLLGRLPFDITNTSTATGQADPDIFTSCDLLNTDIEMYTLWQNWKDHWFYVVGDQFAPSASNAPPVPCTDCPKLNTVPYAAILIFSGERSGNQLRRNNDTENPDPAINVSKANIGNYLEGNNLSNYPDTSGNGNYGVGGVNQTDRYFCIQQDMSIANPVSECNP